MSKLFFIIALICGSFLLQSCNSVNSQAVEMQTDNFTPPVPETTPTPETKTRVSSNGKAEFKGVSFSYNPQVFGEVKAEEVAEYLWESEDYKPDYVEPAHRYFEFDLPKAEYSEMYLSVYPLADFPRMYSVSKIYEESMKEEISNLEKILIDKDFRVEGEIPFLKYYDASQSFQEKVKHFSFPNGQGILFLTHWDIEFAFIGNRQLRYVFQGITNDKKYYILAEMPASVDFLPNEATDEFEGMKIPYGKLRDENEIRKIKNFKQKISKRLDKLPSNKFKTDLKYFEEIISSLKIEQ